MMKYPAIDVANMEFSLLLVTPKPLFLSWLETFAARRGLSARRMHFTEEDSVWLIPPYARLADHYDRFLGELKPRMYVSEFYRFGAGDADIPQPPSVRAFDDYFELDLRDDARLYTEIYAASDIQGA